MARHCKNCGQTGHYAKTCKEPKKDVAVEQAQEVVQVVETEKQQDSADQPIP